MKPFDYGDERIGSKEIIFLLPAYIHGVLILTVPRIINEVTHTFDGWIALLVGGLIGTLFAWMTAKLVIRFPEANFLQFAGQIVTRPVAYAMTAALALHFLLIAAYEVSAVGRIAQMYLLPKTPVEVSALAFLLILIYGVSGSRVGLLRLNLMFFPIYMLLLIVSYLIALGNFEWRNLQPMFVTDIPTMVQATGRTVLTVVGYELLLLYAGYARMQKRIPQWSVYGMTISAAVLLFSYTVVIGVMGSKVPVELILPSIDMVKEAIIPGGFIERSDIIFFVIWITTIFNTGAMAYDAIILSLGLMFPRVRKIHWVLVLAPIVYLISMQPHTLMDALDLLKTDLYLQVFFSYVVPPLLFVIAAVRKLPKGVRQLE
ncbi:GerAB/ArcD/ProY family transporter [Paenibacillus piri]|uniref:Spore gernimation protein n=1 Tax=Paenibacillus piri TaxID=2547395 RepID=A0A4R5KFM7_9BACL|nr:endospore germination permease [Paenibacillus piri]TDF94113.1 spore gernimation protein [Paenibacillus piri]